MTTSSMTMWAYTLTVDGRISAGRRAEQGFHRPAYAVIPGATVRGAFAAGWWRMNDDSIAFARLFDADLRVGQAVPRGAMLRGASEDRCKYQPEESCTQVSHDRAFEFAFPTLKLPSPTCDVCSGPLKASPGWVHTPRSSRRRMAELDADETPVAERLYSREVFGTSVKASLEFTGTIYSSSDLSWLNGLAVSVGGRRSAGLGRARVAITPADLTVEAGARTILRASSPIILLDEYGAPTLRPEYLEAEIARVTGVAVALRDGGRWIRSESIAGWHVRSATPKVAEWAIADGSTFVIDGLDRDTGARLAAGIGYRTAEGYGRYR